MPGIWRATHGKMTIKKAKAAMGSLPIRTMFKTF
jgi:hypothetical protein